MVDTVMAPPSPRYVLVLSCKDTLGIVAAVSGFLARNDGFIIESAQFGDSSTGRFFMRTHFEAGIAAPDHMTFRKRFAVIAKRFDMEWAVHDMRRKPRLLLMASKAGHCINHLLHRHRTGTLLVEIPAIVSNHENLHDMASWHGIPFHYLPVTSRTRAAQEKALGNLLRSLEIDLVVLARYMQVLSAGLCEKLRGRAINIHHSFLPGFKGANPYRQAYDRGVKIIGATAHYVTADLDEGPIIDQEVIRVDHTHTPEDLRMLGQDIESRVLAHAVQYHVEHRVILNDRKTVVF